MNALIRLHLHLDPYSLIDDIDGEADFTKYAEIWSGLEWALKNREF